MHTALFLARCGTCALLALLAHGCSSETNVSPFEIIVPNEPADNRALATLADWRALPTIADGRYLQLSSYDRERPDVADPDDPLLRNGNRDMNHFVCASDDAAQQGPGLVPFVYELEACPEPWVRGFVIARVEGSGRLARLWMTLFSLLRSDYDTMLRVYVDDDQTPLIQVFLVDALDGSAGEIFAPPFGAGELSYLAWYYPVVFSNRLIITVDNIPDANLVYHQTDVVLDETPSERHASDQRLAARDGALQLLAATEDGPVGSAQVLFEAAAMELEPLVAVPIVLDGPATVHSLAVAVPANDVDQLEDIDITVTWDDQPAPAIATTLADLFATRMGAPDGSSLALAAEPDGENNLRLTLRLPMPYRSKGVIALTNRASEARRLSVTITGERELPAEPWGYLTVHTNETSAPASDVMHPVATVSGTGRLVGACLMMEGHDSPDGAGIATGFNFLEGDERIAIDGEPVVLGTGTEDYFNSSFYFLSGSFGTPFAQAWGKDRVSGASPYAGRVTACRWHVLGDVIDFRESLDFALEVGPGEPSLLDRYRSVAFVYSG